MNVRELKAVEFRPVKGLADGLDAIDTPRDAVRTSEGFSYRRGYARSEYGRLKHTSSEIRSAKRVKDLLRWVRADGTTWFVAAIDGAIFYDTVETFANMIAAPHTYMLSKLVLSEKGTTATASRATNVVTITNGHCTGTVAAGDKFFYDADGIADASVVASVDSNTQFTVTAYAGSATSGAFTLWRVLGSNIDMEIAGDRIFVADATNRLHWYGDDGNGTFIFRECGLAIPTGRPSVTLAAGGSLTAGNYKWSVAWGDEKGNISNTIETFEATASGTQKNTMASFANGPAWATYLYVYRSFYDQVDVQYCIFRDITTQLASVAKDNGTSTLTLATGAAALVADEHIHRFVKFATSSTKYRITDNTTTTIVVTGDASGESGTDYVTIAGGFDRDAVQAGSIIDIMSDANLDQDHQAPSENDQPPTKIQYLHRFRGGGRLCGYEDATQTKVWFSGRPTTAPTPTGTRTNGEGEFDYWSVYQNAGNQDGDEIQGFVTLGGMTCCIKQNSVWELDQRADSVEFWGWSPVKGADNVGCIAPKTICVRDGVAYWLGHDGEQVDIIRFDGESGYGLFRRLDPDVGGARLRYTLSTIEVDDSNSTLPTGIVYRGVVWISYPYIQSPAVYTNARTLRYDIKSRTVDIQPWGCGVFCEPYHDTSGNFKLLCGDPTDLGNVFHVLGSQQDNAASIARTLTFGDVGFEGKKINPVYVQVQAVHGEALATAPVVKYATDGLESSRTWTTLTVGDTWPTTIGNKLVRLHFPDDTIAEAVAVQVTSTDAKDWGVRRVYLWYTEKEQLHSLS